jgi:hypothetical protein
VGPLGDAVRGRSTVADIEPAGGDDTSFRREASDGYSNVVVAASLNLIRSWKETTYHLQTEFTQNSTELCT